jgi:hypothetical protein
MPGKLSPFLREWEALGLSGEDQVLSPNPATSKVNYTQGFGSFCFLPHEPKPIRKSRQAKTRFPLLKLPLEIRRMIYRCLVNGLIIAGPPDAGLRFRVTECEDPSDDYDPASCHERPVPPLFIQEAPDQRTRQPNINRRLNKGILDALGVYRSIADPSYPQTAGTPTAAQQPELHSEIWSMDADAESDEVEFTDLEDSDASSWCSDEAEVVLHQRWRHHAQTNDTNPFASNSNANRAEDYDTGSSRATASSSAVLTTLRVTTTIDASPESTRRSHQSKERKVRAAVRNLSLTSAQIACELGEVLWAKATVHFESPTCFLAFAQNRPAAMRLIHGIVVELDVDDGDWLLQGTAHHLIAMAYLVSKLCRLRFWCTLFQTRTSFGYLGRNFTREERQVQFHAAMKGLARWGRLVSQLEVESFAEKHLCQYHPRFMRYLLRDDR